MSVVRLCAIKRELSVKTLLFTELVVTRIYGYDSAIYGTDGLTSPAKTGLSQGLFALVLTKMGKMHW